MLENAVLSTNLLITTAVTITLAFSSYIGTYLNNLRLARRKDQLERLNRQLSELYGPLFALNHAAETARQKFLERYAQGRISFFAHNIAHSEEDLQRWRHWMQTVFMPINMRIYELILSKSDLLIEADMPSVLLRLCGHVASFKVVIEKWTQGDFSEHLALVSFPKELHAYAKASFERLKFKQAKLLGDRIT